MGGAGGLSSRAHLYRLRRGGVHTSADWQPRPQRVGDSRWLFPPPSQWPEDDLIATGADLEPSTLITAYRHGLFPMEVQLPRRTLAWWSPNPRGILPLDRL